MQIGIGVISYNRPKECQEVCEAILKTVNQDAYEVNTICALDTEDKTGYDWVEQNFGLISRPNKGIAVNKNRALKHLKNNDLIFLFEDDFKPRKKGWLELYATAINETKMHHFNHIRLDHRTKMLGQQRYPTVTLVFYENNTAQLMVFTKQVVDKVGAFDAKYGLYGFEHSDYTRRCKNLGLCGPSSHNANHFILESDLFFEEMPVDPCLDEETMAKSIEKANKHYMNYNHNRNYIPFPEGEF